MRDLLTILLRGFVLLGTLGGAVAGATRASAETVHCAGGSPTMLLDWFDPATWDPPTVPGPTTDVLLDRNCHVACRTGECLAHDLKGTSATGSLEIGPGASLVLSGCEHVSVLNSNAFECGAQDGFTFRPQGALVYDSATDGDVALRGLWLPGRPDLLRLELRQAISAQVGDWLQVRSGPVRSHVYRIVGVDLSDCSGGSACTLDLQLHDPAMEFGHNPETAGYAADIQYVGPGGDVRIAGPDQPPSAAADLSRCIEVCSRRVGDDCAEAATVQRDGSLVGWYFGATPTLGPADPAVMGRRHLVVSTRNDVQPAIGPGTGPVDRICFAEPLTSPLIPETGVRSTTGVFWPGFWPGDAWAVFRPATVRYDGVEIDGGLAFYGACVDADYAYFDNWARIHTQEGTPACQRPYQDAVITSHHEGIPTEIADQGGEGGCNGQSLDLAGYTALAGDRVAIVDTRTPLDTSATCNVGSGPFDPAPDSGHHGLSLRSLFDQQAPPSFWLIRYAGDDGVIAGTGALGASRWRFRGWTWWWMKTGISGEVVDFGSSAPGQTFELDDARIVMWAGSSSCHALLGDPFGNVAFEIHGLFYLDPIGTNFALIAGGNEANKAENLLVLGGPDTQCSLQHGGHLENSWIEGWGRIMAGTDTGLSGVYHRGTGGTVSGALLGNFPPGTTTTIRDFVLVDEAAAPLLDPSCSPSCDVSLHDGYARWADRESALAVANLYATAGLRLVEPLAGLVVQNRSLLRCAPGGAETGEHIGVNLVVDPPASGVIDTSGCPLAAPQRSFSMPPLPSPSPYRFELAGETFGPRGPVGLSADETVTAGLDLSHESFVIPAGACADGIDNDLDGAVDAADLGCDGPADPSEKKAGLPCDDGIDDDGDGRIDRLPDRDGDGVVDAPGDAGCSDALYEDPPCQNGRDDDGDGGIDFDGGLAAGLPAGSIGPPDPQCKTPGSRETGRVGCGLGVEIAGLFSMLQALWGRRLRRRAASHR